MNGWVDRLLAWGPLGIFLIALLDAAGVPNPAGVDYLLILLAWKNPSSAYVAAFLGVAGSVIGSFFLYSVARKGGEKYLEPHTRSGRGKKFREWFHLYGLVTVFIPAAVPIFPLPMKVFVLCAGAFKVNPVAFLSVIAAGRLPRYLALAYLGRSLGEDAEGWLKAHFGHFALLALGMFAIFFLLIKWMERRHRATLDRLVSDSDASDNPT